MLQKYLVKLVIIHQTILSSATQSHYHLSKQVSKLGLQCGAKKITK